MTDIRPGSSTQAQFFSSGNVTMLNRLLNSDFQRRLSTDLSSKQQERLGKTIQHYMTEVYAKNPTQPVQYLNKEVLTAVVPDYMSYIRRNAGPTVAEEDGLRLDVNSRFDQIQAERQGVKAPPPAPPDFRISLEEDGPTPLSRFEEVRKMREAEAARESEMAARAVSVESSMSTDLVVVPQPQQDGLPQFVSSDIDFRNGLNAAKARDQLALIMREEARQAARGSEGGAARNAIVDLPDPRRVLLGDRSSIPVPVRNQGAVPNPVLAQPESYRDRPVLPQDILRPQEDLVAYKELEHNLYIYSADRDWVTNQTENRYNFSVNFDPANNRPGFGYSPATNKKFKNIVRIEFVKAIMPVEGCDILRKSSANNGGTIDTSLTTANTFAYPYLQVRIPELNNNGYGTNDGINNAFAAISYDAYWASDSTSTVNKGYARFIPKFLKCQKVFYPTPLGTLTKLSFEIQRPDGELVCDSLDTQDVSGFYLSTTVSTNYYSTAASGPPNTNPSAFLWIRTKAYFNRFAFGQGDRIQFKNIDFTSAQKTSAGGAASQQFLEFINRNAGHMIMDIGYSTDGSTFTVGANSVGYANCIIIKNWYPDPATGSTTPKFFGGSNTAENTMVAAINGVAPSAGRLINLNHQVQIILRVITREMDAAAKLRPDNLQA